MSTLIQWGCIHQKPIFLLIKNILETTRTPGTQSNVSSKTLRSIISVHFVAAYLFLFSLFWLIPRMCVWATQKNVKHYIMLTIEYFRMGYNGYNRMLNDLIYIRSNYGFNISRIVSRWLNSHFRSACKTEIISKCFTIYWMYYSILLWLNLCNENKFLHFMWLFNIKYK